jgi:hypothetical protein
LADSVYLNALLTLERYDSFFIVATGVRNSIDGLLCFVAAVCISL